MKIKKLTRTLNDLVESLHKNVSDNGYVKE